MKLVIVDNWWLYFTSMDKLATISLDHSTLRPFKKLQRVQSWSILDTVNIIKRTHYHGVQYLVEPQHRFDNRSWCQHFILEVMKHVIADNWRLHFITLPSLAIYKRIFHAPGLLLPVYYNKSLTSHYFSEAIKLARTLLFIITLLLRMLQSDWSRSVVFFGKDPAQCKRPRS